MVTHKVNSKTRWRNFFSQPNLLKNVKDCGGVDLERQVALVHRALNLASKFCGSGRPCPRGTWNPIPHLLPEELVHWHPEVGSNQVIKGSKKACILDLVAQKQLRRVATDQVLVLCRIDVRPRPRSRLSPPDVAGGGRHLECIAMVDPVHVHRAVRCLEPWVEWKDFHSFDYHGHGEFLFAQVPTHAPVYPGVA